MILILSKLLLAISIFFLIGFILGFLLYLRAIAPKARALEAALKSDRGLDKMLCKLDYDATVSLYAGPVGFCFVWFALPGLLSLILWIVS